MRKEPNICKDCAEYGSEFCEDCLKEQLEQQQELQRKMQDLTTKKEDAINNS